MTRRHLAGFLILQVIAAATLYAGWRLGLLVPFFVADRTGLVVLIAVVALIGVANVGLRRWDDVAFISKHLPSLGLLGTVVGFSVAIAGLTADFDIKLLGLHTALNTTLAGLVGHLWLSLNERILK